MDATWITSAVEPAKDIGVRMTFTSGDPFDIPWSPPARMEPNVEALTEYVAGVHFDDLQRLMPLEIRERWERWQRLEKAQLAEPEWQELLRWWQEGRPGN